MIAFVDVSLIFAFALLRRLPRRIYDYMTSDRLLTAATLFHHFSFDSKSLVFDAHLHAIHSQRRNIKNIIINGRRNVDESHEKC